MRRISRKARRERAELIAASAIMAVCGIPVCFAIGYALAQFAAHL